MITENRKIERGRRGGMIFAINGSQVNKKSKIVATVKPKRT